MQSTDVLDVATETVGHLQTLPLEALSPAELEALVDQTTTLARRLDSVRLAAVGELADRAEREGRPAREVRDLVQRTSQDGAGAARRTVETAQALGRLPETAAALAEGSIGVGKAELVVRTATTLTGDTLAGDAPEDPSMVEAVADVDRLGAGLGPLTSPYKLRDALEDTAHRHQPTTLAERDAAAMRNRTYTGWVDRDGMYNGAFRVPKLQGEAIETLIDSLSKPHSAQDDRTPGQRRADALVDVCTTMLEHGAPESGGYRPQIVAVADIATLSDQPGAPAATLAHTGTISTETLQALGCDAAVARVVMDGKSTPLDVGRASRTATATQRKALIARDKGCIGCGAPPGRCQAHHIVWWRHKGRTDITNLALVCWACHDKIHHLGWHVIKQPDGTYALAPPQPDKTDTFALAA